MKIITRIATLIFFAGLLSTFMASAQLSAEQKKKTIDSILLLIKRKYVIAEALPEIERNILQYHANGKYDTISTGKEFAFQLTADLQKITNDQHLKVQYSVKNQTDQAVKKIVVPNDNWAKDLLIENNYGIKKKAILEGNIGYLSIPIFGTLKYCADTLIAAMDYVKGTDALIIDLRECRGSIDENTIPFLCSYFFSEPVHLDDFYTRETNSTKQLWTYAYVPGSLYLDKPIYILTSGRTFSGGEAFAYHLQQLKRSNVVGEVTRGGANPTELQRIDNYFTLNVPYAASINPISHTNWERVGVVPNVKASAILALYEANLLALRELITRSSDGKGKIQLQQVLNELKKPTLKKVSFELEGYAKAKEIAVAGSFNFFSRKSLFLKMVNGKWVGTTEVEPGDMSYLFVVDGRTIKDPKNPNTVIINGSENSYKVIK